MGQAESTETTEICCLWPLAYRMRHFVAFKANPAGGDGASVTREVTLDGAQADAESLGRLRTVAPFERQGSIENLTNDVVESPIQSHLDDVVATGGSSAVRALFRCYLLQG